MSTTTTPSYTTRVLASRIRDALTTGNVPKPWDPDGEVVSVTASLFFSTLFGHLPSECPMDTSGALELCEEAARLACQEPGPTRLSYVLVTFRKPDGSLVDDTTSYSIPGAYEAAEEDAHRYGWQLVGFSISWK